MNDAKFLPKVIEYDRYQPNFTKIQLHVLTKGLQTKKLKLVKYCKKNKN